MNIIYKYALPEPITVGEPFTAMIPQGGVILHVGPDPSGQFCLWARVWSLDPPIERHLLVMYTAKEFPAISAPPVHLLTWNSGRLVLHLFEISPR